MVRGPGVCHERCRSGPRCRSKPGHGFRHKIPGGLSVSAALAKPETTPAAANDLCPRCGVRAQRTFVHGRHRCPLFCSNIENCYEGELYYAQFCIFL